MVLTPKALSNSPVRKAGILLALASLIIACSVVLTQRTSCQAGDTLLTEPVVMNLSQTRDGNNLHLEWYTMLRGDFTRDGKVGVEDVTPIAMYFGRDGSESEYMAFLSGSPMWSVTVSSVSYIAMNYGITAQCYEIWLAPDEGELRLVKRVEWDEYITPLTGLPRYSVDVQLEDNDQYVYVTAVLNPDPEWHEDYLWSIH